MNQITCLKYGGLDSSRVNFGFMYLYYFSFYTSLNSKNTQERRMIVMSEITTVNKDSCNYLMTVIHFSMI